MRLQASVYRTNHRFLQNARKFASQSAMICFGLIEFINTQVLRAICTQSSSTFTLTASSSWDPILRLLAPTKVQTHPYTFIFMSLFNRFRVASFVCLYVLLSCFGWHFIHDLIHIDVSDVASQSAIYPSDHLSRATKLWSQLSCFLWAHWIESSRVSIGRTKRLLFLTLYPSSLPLFAYELVVVVVVVVIVVVVVPVGREY